MTGAEVRAIRQQDARAVCSRCAAGEWVVADQTADARFWYHARGVCAAGGIYTLLDSPESDGARVDRGDEVPGW